MTSSDDPAAPSPGPTAEPSGPAAALAARWADVHALRSAAALAEWDQETMMPPGGQQDRGRMLSALAGMAHGLMCDPSLADAVAAVAEAAEPGSPEEALAREAALDISRATAVPEDLARRLAAHQSRCLTSWQGARAENDFSPFAADLAEMVTLVSAQSDAFVAAGLGTTRYDALLDVYEPGATTAHLRVLFGDLGRELTPLAAAAAEACARVDLSPVTGNLPGEAQRSLVGEFARSFGYDWDRGRLDPSTHPFSISFGPGDARITWRWDSADLRPGLFGVLHETGHALYEQGLPAEWSGTPLGEAVSLGVHESQSRLWENLVGRSPAFWRWAAPRLEAALPGLNRPGDAAEITRAVNLVRPSLIRVEADEVTYNLHVALRFELEERLFRGDIATADLPEAWEDASRRWLGIGPPTPAEGVLQDIHWAMGSFGYFPTYTIGNLLAAQLFAAAGEALGDLDALMERGDFAPLLGWLRENVHSHGRRYRADELTRRATGSPLGSDALLTHLRGRVRDLYGA